MSYSEARDLIADNDLAFACNSVGRNPFMPQDSEDLSHWFCSFSGGPVDEFNFYLSLGEAYEGNAPEPAFALSLVLEDIRSFQDCKGYDDLARLLGIDDSDEGVTTAGEEIERLTALVELLRSLRNTPASM